MDTVVINDKPYPGGGYPINPVDDTTTSTSKAWSSDKTSSELTKINNKIGNLISKKTATLPIIVSWYRIVVADNVKGLIITNITNSSSIDLANNPVVLSTPFRFGNTFVFRAYQIINGSINVFERDLEIEYIEYT